MKNDMILAIGSLLFLITSIFLSIRRSRNAETSSEIERQKMQSDIDFYLMAGLVLGTGYIVIRGIKG